MKKSIILTTIIILIALVSKSQITIENTYPNGYATLTNLTNSGYKYYVFDKVANQIKIYNTNHSIFNTINLVQPTGTYKNSVVKYLSDNLFATDNLIEFAVIASNTVTPFDAKLIIYNENNNVLLTLNNTQKSEILNINGSFKLNRASYPGDTSVIYSLPGTLPCDACGGPTGIIKNNSTTNTMPNAYPNPTSTQITIPYTLINSDTKGKINIYDITGKILREYNVDNTFENLILDTQEFSAGTYYYNLTSNSGVSDAKKIIVIK
jgi:hypothetical protein